MSFITDAWDVVTSVVGSGGGSTGSATGLGGWGNVIKTGVDIGGTLLDRQANEDARRAVEGASNEQIRFQREATERAITLFEDSRDRGLTALDQSHVAALAQLGIGEEQAQKLYGDLLRSTGGGFETFRRIAGEDPSRLTAAQEVAKTRLREDIQAGLSASLLRGAGRAGHAVTARALGDFEAQAIEANRARRLEAARGLATANLSGRQNQITDAITRATQRANLESAQGSNLANISTGFGTRAGAAVTGAAPGITRSIGDIGEARGAADVAGAKLTGEALGKVGEQLSTFFTRAEKDERIDTDVLPQAIDFST